MDDNDDWFSSADDAAPEPAPAAAAAAPAAAAAAPEEAATAEAAPAQEEAAAAAAEAAGDDEYLDPDKLLLFKHWIRPRFLPYKYLTDYRRNYYDDVIDYLDKRCKGIFRDIPVAQTWGERMLRTYTKKSNQAEIFRLKLQDRKLVEETRFSGKFQLHHGKNYINTRYYSILY